MKVICYSPTSKSLEERDYRSFYSISIDGKEAFYVSDGEPEDSNLSRDFNNVYRIPDLMKIAYEAGKQGEMLEIEDREVEEA